MRISEVVVGRGFPKEEDESIEAVDMDDAADECSDGAMMATLGAKKCGARCS